MSSWTQKQEVAIGKIEDKLEDIEVKVSVHLMHNGYPYEEFACQLEFPHPRREEVIELARIDKSHGFLHLDKLWLDENEKKRLYDSMDVWEAAEYLKENWKSYFRKWSNRDNTKIAEIVRLETL